jgi:hypothetical protein
MAPVYSAKSAVAIELEALACAPSGLCPILFEAMLARTLNSISPVAIFAGLIKAAR